MAKTKLIQLGTGPEELFRIAEGFYQEGKHLANKWIAENGVGGIGTISVELDRGRIAGFLPAIVLQAFAVELFLKCLLHVDMGNIPATHKVDDLFLALSIAMKMQVEAAYKEILSKNPSTIMDMLSGNYALHEIGKVLSESADSFTQFRYFFEYPASSLPLKPFVFKSMHVGEAARQVLLSKNPKWK